MRQLRPQEVKAICHAALLLFADPSAEFDADIHLEVRYPSRNSKGTLGTKPVLAKEKS